MAMLNIDDSSLQVDTQLKSIVLHDILCRTVDQFFQLTIYRGINGDLSRRAAEFNEMPRQICRIFPRKATLPSHTPGGRLPLLPARPEVSLPASKQYRR